ncbi:MAG: HAD family hydrolase [Hadesarchaea archaeon]|nr:HAD family hydrolase [Hadesarchaea archaeon]
MITAKAVIFDLDCTLVDTLRRFFDVFNELLVERGDKPLQWDRFFERYVADTLDDVIAAPSSEGREERLHEFWLEFLRRYRDGDPGSKLIPGVKEVLGQLHRDGVPIAVITSCIVSTNKLRRELAGLGLNRFASAVATAHDVVEELEQGHHFSKVEIFRLAAGRLGVDPRECVVVGDYWNDVRDGKTLGARTVAVLTGLMRRELLEKYGPDMIIESVRDLPKVVKFETKS